MHQTLKGFILTHYLDIKGMCVFVLWCALAVSLLSRSCSTSLVSQVKLSSINTALVTHCCQLL